MSGGEGMSYDTWLAELCSLRTRTKSRTTPGGEK